jgi:hypothetical protein
MFSPLQFEVGESQPKLDPSDLLIEADATLIGGTTSSDSSYSVQLIVGADTIGGVIVLALYNPKRMKLCAHDALRWLNARFRATAPAEEEN